MPGIPWEVAEHALRLIQGSRPAKQRLHRFDDERRRAIGEEITKLLAAGFIKEVFHSDWLANPVLVRKKTGKWRMFNIRLNPKKCVFGQPKGKLLGYIMSEHGIEANPEKITSISKMGPIRNVKSVQRLTGCLAALSRFIS
ncbi:uncharacterized protein [Miscanthus floridulus]|uniref:uncharacterized protein n=1 Tax=Miscanthus floridulus TaxID=154761 RepID=UPI00345824A4